MAVLKRFRDTLGDVLAEFKEILKISWPIIVASAVNMFNWTIGGMFVGHLGKDVIDAVTLATTVVLVFGAGFHYGMATACDTLLSQAFGSANKLYVGVAIQRGVVVTLNSCLVVSAICINTEHMLVSLGQEPHISRVAGRYAKGILISVPAFCVADVLRKTVYIQGYGKSQVAVWLGSLIINLVLNYVLVIRLDMGPDGSIIAMTVTSWTQLAMIIILIIKMKLYRGVWHGLSFECLEDWGEYFAMGIPGAMMLLMKWIASTATVLVSGTIGTVELAAYGISQNIAKYFAMISAGLTTGSAVRLGMRVGARRQDEARFTSTVNVILAFVTGIIFAAVVLALKNVYPYLYTSERDVVELTERLSYHLALYIVFSMAELTIDANIRGTGNQFKGAVVIMTAYFLVGLPIAIPLMLLTDLGIYGGFLGLAVGVAYQCAVYLIIVYKMDWAKEVELAQKRARIFSLPKDAVNGVDMELSVSASGKTRYGSVNVETSQSNGVLQHDDQLLLPEIKEYDDAYGLAECCICKGQLNMRTLTKRLVLAIFLVLVVCVSLWLDSFLTNLRGNNSYEYDHKNTTESFFNATVIV